jgi:hypothetical protein
VDLDVALFVYGKIDLDIKLVDITFALRVSGAAALTQKLTLSSLYSPT